MKLSDMMKERQLLSFELFPPKTDKGMENLPGTIDKLCEFKPEYISCTYGAGGTNVGKNMDVCKMIQNAGTTAVTHFTCIGNTREGIKDQLQNYLDNGVDHMLALRGDLPFGWTGTGGDFKYATDLVAYVRKEFGDKFEIAVAGSPEGHIACRSLESDVAVLKQKQDNGADYILTQLCWDMEQFKRWLDAIRGAGIWLPVDVGVMPVLNKESTIRMCLSMNGCAIPAGLARHISKYYNDPEGFKEAGKEFTVDQIMQYSALGVDGMHLYALNQWKEVTDILVKANLWDLAD